jgi:hypothetical protein
MARGRSIKIGIESSVDLQQKTQNSWRTKCKYVVPYFWGQKRFVSAQTSFWSPMRLEATIWLDPLSNFMECGIWQFSIGCFCKARVFSLLGWFRVWLNGVQSGRLCHTLYDWSRCRYGAFMRIVVIFVFGICRHGNVRCRVVVMDY